MKALATACHSFKRMPFVLKHITGMCCVFTLFLPAALIPGGNYRIDEEPVTFAEFWQRGGGLVFMMLGVLFGVIACGVLQARQWVRRLLPAFPIPLATAALWDRDWAGVIAMLVFAGAGYYTMWRHPAAVAYFNSASCQPANG
jgi:hypothetical protein